MTWADLHAGTHNTVLLEAQRLTKATHAGSLSQKTAGRKSIRFSAKPPTPPFWCIKDNGKNHPGQKPEHDSAKYLENKLTGTFYQR